MSEERNIDIEAFRAGMRPLSARIREALKDFVGGLFHRNWAEVEAEVRDCTPMRPRTCTSSRQGVLPTFGGYVVAFKYVVNGRSYEGITSSQVEVNEHDRFSIRYNPKHPEENNTFNSETNWATAYTKYITIIMIVLGLFLLIRRLFFGG